jgi:DcmR-like sensory protein
VDLTDAKINFRGKAPGERNRQIRLGGSALGTRSHICAFFNNPDDEYRVLLPFIKDGLQCGEKAVHTVDPDRCDDHLRRLAAAGIDVATACESGQFELRTWTDTHLRNGRFDQNKTLALFEEVVKDAKRQGFPLIRFITHMEWALEDRPGVDDLLEDEARANDVWLCQDGPVNPVICTKDLTKFGGDIVVDVMQTHPMIIIGGILFFVPPDEFLKELRERRILGRRS